MSITVNAVAENSDIQQIIFRKDPGQPIQCTVIIGCDKGPPFDRTSTTFPLSAVATGPSVASLKAVRDFALAQLGL